MLHKGDKYRDVDGTVFQIFSAMDDTYTYYFIANLSQYTVTRMLPKNAEIRLMELFYKGKRVSKKKLGQYPFKDLLEMQNALNRTIINRGKTSLNVTYDMSYIKFYQKLVNLELVRRNEIRKTNNLARKRGKVAYEQLQEELYKRSKN